MKTAQETYEHILQEKPSEAAFLIQKYAKEVAERTLRDANDNFSEMERPSYEEVQESILSTQIFTP